jgi:HSP20 family protein
MDDLLKLHFQVLHGRVRAMFRDLAPGGLAPGGGVSPWSPNLNVLRCADRFIVWVELAGVDRSAIAVRAEPRRLSISGQRRLPPQAGGTCLQVLALEIDEGAFQRTILLPEEIVPEAVTAEHRDGLLRIELPLAPLATQPPSP